MNEEESLKWGEGKPERELKFVLEYYSLKELEEKYPGTINRLIKALRNNGVLKNL